MGKVKIAINGFGRIGRLTTHYILDHLSESVDIVAINDLTNNKTLAHLLKYDTAHGVSDRDIKHDDVSIEIDNNKIHAFAEKDPESLPWKKLDIDVVLECTGVYRTREGMEKHLKAGAKKVVLSAPGKGGNMKTIVMGVNEHILEEEDHVFSNASCTTNCLAPMVKVLDDNWGFEEGFMTTVHAYTADQQIQDAPHKDLRRARAAALNIVPTTTGAAKAVELVMPHLKGKLTGLATRVPVIDGSLTDLTCILKSTPSKEEINAVFKKAAETNMKGIIEYQTDPIVSSDIIKNIYSCIFDSELTAVNNKLVKVVGWYDNEMGYAARMADIALYLKKFL